MHEFCAPSPAVVLQIATSDVPLLAMSAISEGIEQL
jgi:hypothetical protein